MIQKPFIFSPYTWYLPPPQPHVFVRSFDMYVENVPYAMNIHQDMHHSVAVQMPQHMPMENAKNNDWLYKEYKEFRMPLHPTETKTVEESSQSGLLISKKNDWLYKEYNEFRMPVHPTETKTVEELSQSGLLISKFIPIQQLPIKAEYHSNAENMNLPKLVSAVLTKPRTVNKTITQQHVDNKKPKLGVFKTSQAEKSEVNKTGDWREIGEIQYNLEHKLGSGSNGTVVYKGIFDKRPVAVKRIVKALVSFESINREIELLRKSDFGQHIIRYFFFKFDEDFYYIALELAEQTLGDYVKSTEEKNVNDNVDIISQMGHGISYLHQRNLIHRDIKPSNILLTNEGTKLKAKLSDFGLCKELQSDQTSMTKTAGNIGTEGWQAPELMEEGNRITSAVDIFAFGIVIYYVLTNGQHPFGEYNFQKANILQGNYNFAKLEENETSLKSCAKNLIGAMYHKDPNRRPKIQSVISHPMLWSDEKQLNFFMEVGDRLEKECQRSDIIRRLEKYCASSANNWLLIIPLELKEYLTDYLYLNRELSNSPRDLLRIAIRNIKNHYTTIPQSLKDFLGDIPSEYINFWNKNFPKLLIQTYAAMSYLKEESVFKRYYTENAQLFCDLMVNENTENRSTNTDQNTLPFLTTSQTPTPSSSTTTTKKMKNNSASVYSESYDDTFPPINGTTKAFKGKITNVFQSNQK